MIQALQTAGLERFLRRKVEIDRTAILREWGGMDVGGGAIWRLLFYPGLCGLMRDNVG